MDRRTLKTRRALYTALLHLLTQRPWEEIDVQTLCEVADVGRSTFYAHFQNRERLLQSCFADICQGFAREGSARLLACDPSGPLPPAFLAPLMEHIGEQRPVFRVLLGKRSNAYVRQAFQHILVDLVRADLEHRALRPAWRVDALAHALAGAILATIQWWVNGNPPRKPAEVVALLESQTRALIEQAQAPA